MSTSTERLYELFLESTGVSTDSRTVEKGHLFFGLSGPNFNGSQYAASALEKGASYAVVDDPVFVTNDQIFLVDDALIALQDLARHHRRLFKGPVIGITGSNGKTTTKELVREVMAKKFNVHATKGNFNNHIGVALTILQWTEDTEMAIVEMGANHVGEIGFLSSISMPSHGLITNIGHAHTEGFGGIEGVLRGKTELFDFLRQSVGTTFLNVSDMRLKHMAKRFDKLVTYPSGDLEVLPNPEFLHASWKGRTIKTQLTGAYNFPNVAAAIALGLHFEVAENDIISAIEGYVPENQRSQLIKKNGHTIIMDAYNANPDSMRAALLNLTHFPGYKVAIIGDMNELQDSDEQHRSLGEEISQMAIDEVILVGEKIRPAMESLPIAKHYPSTVDLLKADSLKLTANSTVLLKASRSIKLEQVLEKL
jgi:UDP-N-acetylmuramoyl-tripeptide--D-alanyl-D-alanine ligase